MANGAEELKYELVGRDIIVTASIEFVSKVHNFDGLVTLVSCENIIAGCYVVSARLNIPALCVTGGSMQAGNYKGRKMVDAELDVAVLGVASAVVRKIYAKYCAQCLSL